MEICEGGTLLPQLNQISLTETRAAHIMRHVARALAYIHSKRIVHRDIKARHSWLLFSFLVSLHFLAFPSFGFQEATFARSRAIWF